MFGYQWLFWYRDDLNMFFWYFVIALPPIYLLGILLVASLHDKISWIFEQNPVLYSLLILILFCSKSWERSLPLAFLYLTEVKQNTELGSTTTLGFKWYLSEIIWTDGIHFIQFLSRNGKWWLAVKSM